jgi:hypothetical protein
VIRYGQQGRKASWNVKKISKIWKKYKLNTEMIWKIWMKSKLKWNDMENMEENSEKTENIEKK